MSYSARELFAVFVDIYEGGPYVASFLKSDDPEVTGVAIPVEYKALGKADLFADHDGKPIVTISQLAFSNCKYLREVYIPDSVKTIDTRAFENCPELRQIRLPKHIIINPQAFHNCPRLAPEAVMAGIIGSPDLSRPFRVGLDMDSFSLAMKKRLDWDALLRPDVFELVIKYDSFREIGTEMLFKEIVRRGLFSHFEMLENAGRSPDAEQTDRLIEFSSENGYTEMTAYLLDYKNRKFGFSGGDNLEL